MARFFGPLGFVTFSEIPEGSGIWKSIPVERAYRGNVIKNVRRWDTANDQVNDDINITNTISIVADPYVSDHLNELRYVKWLGNYWKITSIEVVSPRLNLSIGGVYNGPTVESPQQVEEHPSIR